VLPEERRLAVSTPAVEGLARSVSAEGVIAATQRMTSMLEKKNLRDYRKSFVTKTSCKI
jgi:hypothetical protein